MNKFYTYAHYRNDTNELFYIGKGTEKRAWKRADRSELWSRITKKHGRTVQILAYWDTEQEAFDHEKLLISCFRDMGKNLINFTDGGDGISGYRHTDETRKKLSENGKKLYSNKEYAKRMAAIRKEQWTKEAREKASKSSKKVWTEDVKKQHSEILKKSYSSEEMRKVQADKNRKYRESKEGRKAMAERSKKYWNSPESQTEEAKRKRSEATFKAWETRRKNNEGNK
jgi:hypothetical protein